MTYYAIIVAGGKGTRMKSNVPKQFLLLGGKPVLMHSIEKFFKANSDTRIILVLPKEEQKVWRALCRKHYFNIRHTIVTGGATRFDSVKNGLQLIKKDGVTAVHDGVRPLVSERLIRRAYKKAALKGNAVPCESVVESIRILNGKKNRIANRKSVVLIQTPQCFRTRLLKNAYKVKFRKEFTDDASVMEAFGERIHLIKGERMNIKITNREDLPVAELLLKVKKKVY